MQLPLPGRERVGVRVERNNPGKNGGAIMKRIGAYLLLAGVLAGCLALSGCKLGGG